MLLVNILDSVKDSLFSVSPALAQSAGAMLVTAIWQAGIVALCLATALKIARGTTAALRFSIWIAGFIAVVCLPFGPLFSLLTSRLAAHPTYSVTPLPSGASSAWLHLDLRWSVGLALIWIAASIYRAADLAIHAVRLRSLWREAKPVPAEMLNGELLPILESGLGSRRRIEICTTVAQDRPSVIGFFAPRILIPEWLLDRLTPAELKQIVIHETEHLRRGDDWTNLLQKLGLVLFPLNPALLWMDRRLCLEREMACDEAVVRATRAPRAYAACLTNLAEHGRVWRHQALEQALERALERARERAMERAALSLGAWRRRSELVGRVQSILRSRGGRELGALRCKAIFAVAACGLAIGSVELARCPQLIAFVPVPTEQGNQRLAQVRPAPTPLPSASGTAQQMLAISTRSVPAANMSDLKAIMPAGDAFASTEHSDIQPRNTDSSFRAQAAQIPRPLAHDGTPFMQPAATDANAGIMRADLREPAAEPRQAGWLVLTTWEEVSTTDAVSPASENASVVQSADAPVAGQLASDGSSEPSAQQIRVTRLVFRVIPASFVSPDSPVAKTRAMLRDGWLVLQL